jgi:hypothetical protein
MKKNIIYAFAIIFVFSSSGCKNENPTITLTPETIEAPQFSAETRTLLKVDRNGEIYEIDGSKIETLSDFNKDGESEIIVSKISCGTYCVSWLTAYNYVPIRDHYAVSDELGVSLRKQIDLNNDNIPEFIIFDGYCFRGWCHRPTEASALTILGYDGSRFSDITVNFPELIQEDAIRLLELSKTRKDQLAYIALPGYLFNMYRLDKIGEGRKTFNEVCNTVTKPGNITCDNFLLEVEESILEYKLRQ